MHRLLFRCAQPRRLLRLRHTNWPFLCRLCNAPAQCPKNALLLRVASIHSIAHVFTIAHDMTVSLTSFFIRTFRCWRCGLRCGLALAMLVVLALGAGCDSPFRQKDYLGRVIPREQFQEIDTVDFAKQSRRAPVTIDEAIESITTDIVAPPPPPAVMEVSLADVRAAALQNNLDLQVELFNPAIAAEDITAEEAAFESVFFASARRS